MSEQRHLALLLDQDDDAGDVREADIVVFTDCSHGLGLKILGGRTEDGSEDFGIFIKKILPGGLAEADGTLCEGDQILTVNSESLEGVTNDMALAVLRRAAASNHMEMIFYQDEQAREEYGVCLEKHNLSSSLLHDSSSSQPNTSRHEPRTSGSQSSFGQSSADQCSSNQEVTYENVNPRVQSPPICPTKIGHSPQLSASSPLAAEISNFAGFPGSVQPNCTSSPRNEYTPTPASISLPSTSPSHKVSRKISIDPHSKVKVEKLEMTLHYLGLEPNAEQREDLHRLLVVDDQGQVEYGAFVQAAKQVFHTHLKGRRVAWPMSPPPTSPPPEQPHPPGQGAEEYVDQEILWNERNQLRLEVQKLRDVVREKERSCYRIEEDLHKFRREAQVAVEESRSLRSKLLLAEQAQQAARTMETDYEEVVTLLENEITQLRLQLVKVDGVASSTPGAVQKRLAVLACQLKKSQAGRKTYEVTTDKLLNYVEHVQEALTQHCSEEIQPKNDKKEQTNQQNKKMLSLKYLAKEGQDVVKVVKSLIETVPLPYGWEEAYMADGTKYYINHSNQTTTWTHPVSGVQHQLEDETSQSQLPNIDSSNA